MEDDLQTPPILSAFPELVKHINNNVASLWKVLQDLKAKALIRAELSEEEVKKLIEERDCARKKKDFEASDGIRTRLEEVGIKLMDNTPPQGTIVWRPSIPPKYDQHLILGDSYIYKIVADILSSAHRLWILFLFLHLYLRKASRGSYSEAHMLVF